MREVIDESSCNITADLGSIKVYGLWHGAASLKWHCAFRVVSTADTLAERHCPWPIGGCTDATTVLIHQQNLNACANEQEREWHIRSQLWVASQCLLRTNMRLMHRTPTNVSVCFILKCFCCLVVPHPEIRLKTGPVRSKVHAPEAYCTAPLPSAACP